MLDDFNTFPFQLKFHWVSFLEIPKQFDRRQLCLKVFGLVSLKALSSVHLKKNAQESSKVEALNVYKCS